MPVLYLVPSPLSDNSISWFLPQEVINVIHGLHQFIVEDVRTARRFLSKIKHPQKIENLSFRELNEHTSMKEIPDFLTFIRTADTGVISEAGLPAVADPGAEIVSLAHANSIQVVALTGPSAIFMALMASGLNGQSFAFAGYLPVKQNLRQARLRALEKRSKEEKQTQIFIETPYRNMQLFDDIIKTCHPDTKLSIAANITAPDEFVRTKLIRQWKTNPPAINKIPTVFLLQG